MKKLALLLAAALLISLCACGSETPMPTDGSTAENLYYLNTQKNALMRLDLNSGETSALRTFIGTAGNQSYVVTEEAIYFVDDNHLYRVWYDGSGEKSYSGTYAHGPASLAVGEDWIYACNRKGGQLGGTSEMVRISKDGDRQESLGTEDTAETLLLDSQGRLMMCKNDTVTVWTETEDFEYTVDFSVVPLCVLDDKLISWEGQAISLTEDNQLSVTQVFEMDTDSALYTSEYGTPLGGVGHYLCFETAEETLCLLDIDTGETAVVDCGADKFYASGRYGVVIVKNEPVYAFDGDTGEALTIPASANE